MNDKTIWIESYRPTELSQYVFSNNSVKKFVENIIETGEIPNLLLSGNAGSGKSSLSRLLINKLVDNEFDYMIINCSDESSVDDMRTKVSSFAYTCSMSNNNKYKIIEMSECDQLSHHAQGALRHIIEDTSENCRFIFTCNYPNKMISALHSRLHHIEFNNPSTELLIMRLVSILNNENVAYEISDLVTLIKLYYPDIRKIINVMQQNVLNNKLTLTTFASTTDSEFIDMVNNLENISINDLQKFVGQIQQNEFESYYQYLYRHERFNDMPEIYITIADKLYQHSLVGLPEITFLSLLIQLREILKESN